MYDVGPLCRSVASIADVVSPRTILLQSLVDGVCFLMFFVGNVVAEFSKVQSS
jgi:hypothetical protein